MQKHSGKQATILKNQSPRLMVAMCSSLFPLPGSIDKPLRNHALTSSSDGAWGARHMFCSRGGCNKLRLAHRRTCSCRSRAHQSSLCGYPARCEVATLLASERVALAPELQVVPAEVLPQEAGAVAAVAQGRHRRNHCYRHRVGPMHLRCLQARLPKNHHWLRLSRRHLHRPLVVAVAVVVVVAECCCCKYAAAAATTAAATNKQQIKQHKSKHKQQLNSNINYFNAHRLARL